MLRKILIALAGLILSLSLFLNYRLIKGADDPVVNSSGWVYFSSYTDYKSLSFDGCLLWKDPKQKYSKFHQYWKVNAIERKGATTCSVVTGSQIDGKVIIHDPDPCQVTSLDAVAKTASIIYKDAVISVNSDRAIWTNNKPEEKGGGDLVNCIDLNWRLL